MLEATILSVVIVLCITILVHSHMDKQIIETIVEKVVYTSYIPEELLRLSGAIQADNGGLVLRVMVHGQIVELWYINNTWRLHDTSLWTRTADKWIKVSEAKVMAMLGNATPAIAQQPALALGSHQPRLTSVQANMQPNVSAKQAQQWWEDVNHGWKTDPRESGLVLPSGYFIRKDTTQYSPTYDMFIVDKQI